MEPHHEQLTCGLRVTVLPKMDVPVVTTMLVYHVGSVDEREGETGLAHFLEHMMFKGTDRYAVGDIDLATQRAGGSNNAMTTYDYTGYYLDLPVETWEAALEIEANRMHGCIFDPEEVENERQVVLSELDGGRDNPSRLLYEEVSCLAYQVHPYHHPIIGWRHEVESVPRERMVAFYERFYQPANSDLILCGAVDPAEAIDLVRKHFGDLSARERVERAYTPEPEQTGERRTVLRPADNHLDRLAMAWHTSRVGTDEDHALDVLSAILSSGRTSRLHRKLVEEDRLATGIGTTNDVRLFPGLFYLNAVAAPGVEPGRLEAAIDTELAAIARTPPTDAEMQRAKGMLEAGHLFAQQTTNDIAYLVGMFTAYGHPQVFFDYVDRVRAVRAEDVQEVAQRFLQPERRTVGLALATEGSAAGGAS